MAYKIFYSLLITKKTVRVIQIWNITIDKHKNKLYKGNTV